MVGFYPVGKGVEIGIEIRCGMPIRCCWLFCAFEQKFHHIPVVIARIAGYAMEQIEMYEQYIAGIDNCKWEFVIELIFLVSRCNTAFRE